MNDMRQKLLPVFLEEAGRKVLQLDDFLSAVGGEGKSLADLEAAFRAAHTLKGTAALVQAEAVRSLSARMEGLLEGHFEQNRFPSVVEYEAMQLALDHLKKLIDAVANHQSEPVGLLSEAELALKLAMNLPGRKGFAELLTSKDAEDPFADDPCLDELDLDDNLGDLSVAIESTSISDPFSDDPQLEQDLEDLSGFSSSFAPDAIESSSSDSVQEQAPAASSLESPPSFFDINDPFADDPALEYVQEEVSAGLDDSESVLSDLVSDPLSDQNPVDEAAAEAAPVLQQEDSFIERMRKRIEKESPLQTAERLAKTLLSQDEGDAVARQYSCCRFRVATKDYYLPIENMIEISDLPNIIHLPLAPKVVKGLINIRGQVLPVIDLGLQAGGQMNYVAVRKLVIAEAGGEKLAFLADGIPDLSENIQGEKVDVMNFIDQFRAGDS